jgi:iron only hydrogenase large subunit-like protein
MMAKKLFPAQAQCISMALTPMVLTGRLLKKLHPGCKVAFIGPCAAKKLEASRRSIRSDIDFVLTFEEVMGMFEAKEVDFSTLEATDAMHGASGDGRGFAVSGGVASAVVNCIHDMYPDREVKVESAEGLENCRKLLQMAKAGKYNGYLLEGMACLGGCVAGAGTRQPINKSAAAVQKHKKVSTNQHALQSDYRDLLELLEE